MTLDQQEYEAIINDNTKVITEDIVWEGRPNSPMRKFRIDISSDEGYPIFVKGWYSPRSGKLSYAIIHLTVGRIYGLDLGAAHCNPDGKIAILMAKLWERSTRTTGRRAGGINGLTCRRTLPRRGTIR